MRQVLQQGLLPCGGGRTVGAENKLVEVEGFGEEVLGWWIQWEDVETIPEDLFEVVVAWTISSGERQAMGSPDGISVIENKE